MISGAYTSTEKAGRLFFKRTAAFFREDSDWDAGLLARAPKDIVRGCFQCRGASVRCPSCRANGLFRQSLQITAKGRGQFADVGAGCVYKQVVVFPRTPFLPTEEGVILCTVTVDLRNPFLHLRFC